jgi:1,2-diacylglycerol 3-beta-glucosyltransferase
LTTLIPLLQTILLLIFVVPVGYLLFLMLAAAFYRPRSSEKLGQSPLDYLILIPAHDEALTLPAVLPSILALRSGHGLRKPRVVVVADNCTDNTARLAQAFGAEVLERFDPRHGGKGYALEWAIGELMQEDKPARFEALVILDADTVPDKNFLEEIDRSFQTGARVVQGRYGILNQAQATWRTHLLSTAFLIYNHVRPLGRAVLGLSDGLRGNGMAFRREILEKFPWQAYGLVEDIEYANRLVKAGLKVTYAPAAIIYGQGAASRKQATVQRMRWEGGRFRQVRADVPSLLATALTRASFSALDRALDLLIPPLALLALLLGGLTTLDVILWLVLGGAWLGATVIGWLMLMVALALFVLGGLAVARAPRAAWLALLFAPFYVLWKLQIYIRMLVVKAPKEWIRTPRSTIEARDVPATVVEVDQKG